MNFTLFVKNQTGLEKKQLVSVKSKIKQNLAKASPKKGPELNANTPPVVNKAARFKVNKKKGQSTKVQVEDLPGSVISLKDGVVAIARLNKAIAGELIYFPSSQVYGMIISIEKDKALALLFANDRKVKAGDIVYGSGSTITINVGTGLLGRVIDPLGNPADIKNDKINIDSEPLDTLKCSYVFGDKINGHKRPVETPAPGIIQRKSVRSPLITGLTCIDSMVPIGKGQRELIIGDRQVGKTSIAIDIMLNQAFLNEALRFYVEYKNYVDYLKENKLALKDQVYSIYVGIGQKQSTIARIVKILKTPRHLYERRMGVSVDEPISFSPINYCVLVVASASDAAPLQFLAPYSGCAVGEFFRDNGKHAVIFYDDLSKQAVAYRQMSLLLRRPPGREAYPGDVFYLHSRLLERAAQLSDKLLGGSLTAMPVIETFAGDVSAYIATNVISITDGQIFLESDLFYQGIRPAINVGLSVSRVGSSAQFKAMKQVGGSLKLQLAQYREISKYVKFGATLDTNSQRLLRRGSRLVEILNQNHSSPLEMAMSIIFLYMGLEGYVDYVDPFEIKMFQEKCLSYFKHKRAYDTASSSVESVGEVTDQFKDLFILDALQFVNSNKF